MKRLAVVANPTKHNVAAVRAIVERLASEAGWDESLWYDTTIEDPGRGMAVTAVTDGADVVLAVGGDGTVRAVADGLRGTDVALAICPQGTGNLLARNLGLPIGDIEAAVQAAFAAERRRIDVVHTELERADGEVLEEAYCVMAGVGLDAQIMSNTNPELKRQVGMLAYVGTGAVEVSRNRRMQVEYRVDGGRRRKAKARMVVVGNCGSIGHNVFLMPDALIDDGQLDLLVAKPATLMGWLIVGWRVLVGTISRRRRRAVGRREDRFTTSMQGRSLEFTFEEPEEIELDGDHFGAVVGARFTVDPGALLVCAKP